MRGESTFAGKPEKSGNDDKRMLDARIVEARKAENSQMPEVSCQIQGDERVQSI